jgi:predicted nucleic acid-binding protein
MERELLVDADALVALRDSKDPNHKLAAAVSSQITEAKIPLITSDPAFGEAITVISQNVNQRAAVGFAGDIINSRLEIVEVNAKLRREALEIFKVQKSKNFRFTDAVNIAIMQERGLREIFSFDRDYRKNGFLRLGID